MPPSLLSFLLVLFTTATPALAHADGPVSRESADARPGCAPITGSHVHRQRDADGRCSTASSDRIRSYTADDLARHGRIDLGGTLQSLDPAVDVSGPTAATASVSGGRD